MRLEGIIVLIISIHFLFTTHIADHVFQIYVSFEFILVKEIFITELTEWMQESDITELIDISFL